VEPLSPLFAYENSIAALQCVLDTFGVTAMLRELTPQNPRSSIVLLCVGFLLLSQIGKSTGRTRTFRPAEFEHPFPRTTRSYRSSHA